jgi:hypothetical protein
MSKKIITSASRSGKSITVNWVMKDGSDNVIDQGNMGVDLVNTDMLDYSQSPPVLMTQAQRVQVVVDQVTENLKRTLNLQDAGETDGDVVVAALNGMEVLP